MKILLAVLVFLVAGPVQAQQKPCASRVAVLNHLATNFKETPVAMGLANNGGLLEILASKDGTWTIILTMPNGLTCSVASGQSWEMITEIDGTGT